MKIKNVLLILLSIVSYTVVCAQNTDLGKLSEQERQEYLIELGKDLTKTFGPGYYREYKEPIILEVEKFSDNDKRPEIQKNIGREYYTVIFPYDESKEELDFPYASRVRVWKDTGEPLDVTFGNGYGKNFLFTSYKTMKMLNRDEQVPYQQAKKYKSCKELKKEE